MKIRMDNRDHFMPKELLLSQINSLEEPKNALILDNNLSIEEMIENIKITVNE